MQPDSKISYRGIPLENLSVTKTGVERAAEVLNHGALLKGGIDPIFVIGEVLSAIADGPGLAHRRELQKFINSWDGCVATLPEAITRLVESWGMQAPTEPTAPITVSMIEAGERELRRRMTISEATDCRDIVVELYYAMQAAAVRS